MSYFHMSSYARDFMNKNEKRAHALQLDAADTLRLSSVTPDNVTETTTRRPKKSYSNLNKFQAMKRSSMNHADGYNFMVLFAPPSIK